MDDEGYLRRQRVVGLIGCPGAGKTTYARRFDPLQGWVHLTVGFARDVVKPLQAKVGPVYVVPGSDAEEHVRKRYPSKTVRRVGNGVRPQNIASLLVGMRLTFQRNKARDLDAVYHFRLTGAEKRDVTITFRRRDLTIEEGLKGTANLVVQADSEAWLQFVRKERGLPGLQLSRKLRVKGSPKLLVAFGKCFP